MPWNEREKRLAYSREYNKAHYKEQLSKRLENNKKRQDETRQKIRQLKQGLSCSCGENHIACLDFHHRNPDEKEITIAEVFRKGWGWERIEKEIAKCDVLCKNCHAKLHYNEKHG